MAESTNNRNESRTHNRDWEENARRNDNTGNGNQANEFMDERANYPQINSESAGRGYNSTYNQDTQHQSNHPAHNDSQRRNQGSQHQGSNVSGYQGSSYGSGRSTQGRSYDSGTQFAGSAQGTQYGGSQYGGRGQSNSYSNDSHYDKRSQQDWRPFENSGFGNEEMNNSGQWGNSQHRGNNWGEDQGSYNHHNASGGNTAGSQSYNSLGRTADFGGNQYGHDNRGMAHGAGNEGAPRTNHIASGLHKGKGPKGYQRSDERIKDDINDRFTDDASLDASDIEVAIAGNEVVLTGTVDSRYAKRRAEDLAEMISGVRNVENRLKVSSDRNEHNDHSAARSEASSHNNNDKNKRTTTAA